MLQSVLNKLSALFPFGTCIDNAEDEETDVSTTCPVHDEIGCGLIGTERCDQLQCSILQEYEVSKDLVAKGVITEVDCMCGGDADKCKRLCDARHKIEDLQFKDAE